MSLILVISYLLLVISSLTFTTISYAVTSTPTVVKTSPSTPSSTPSSDLIEKLKQIEILKEKIATRVAQLRENEKVALHGILSSSSSGSITMTTNKGEGHKITYLDDTLFYRITGNKKSAIKSDKLASESAIVVFGYYNEDHSVITAKYLYDVSNNPLSIIGKVSEVNKDDYTVSVTDGKETLVFDYETSTRTSIIAPKGTIWTRSGFSKLSVGDSVRVVGIADVKEKDRWDAQNIYIIISTLQPTVPTTKPTPTEKLSKSSSPAAIPTSL